MKLLRNSIGNYVIVSNNYLQRNLNTPNNSLDEVINTYKTYGLLVDKGLRTRLLKLLKQDKIKEVASFKNINDLKNMFPEEFI